MEALLTVNNLKYKIICSALSVSDCDVIVLMLQLSSYGSTCESILSLSTDNTSLVEAWSLSRSAMFV
jgi:hypothetical protein